MFDEAHIRNVMDLLLLKWLDGTADWVDLAIAMQLACGPRIAEIIHYANFVEVQHKEGYITQVLLLFIINFVLPFIATNLFVRWVT
jgi:hypothetical protein